MRKRFSLAQELRDIDRCSYLTSVEKRLKDLEGLVLQLAPGANVEALLNAPNRAPSNATSGTLDVSHSVGVEVGRSSISPGPQSPVLPEAVPNSADGFNWREEEVAVDGVTDGMAALSVEPTGVGYLGLHPF